MDQLISYLLSLHKIFFDKEELIFQIQSHPSYPSLHAITGVLDHFHINNLALNVPVNEDILTQLPNTFMAQVNTETGENFVIAQKNNDHYKLFFNNKKKVKITINEFLEKFTGIMLAIEKTEDLDQIDRVTTPRLLDSFLILISFLLLIGVVVISRPTLIPIFYLLTSLLGVYVSIAISKQVRGEQSFLGDTFCVQAHKKNNCNSVLTSSGAQIGYYTLSDFSIIYFIGISITTVLLSLSQIDFNLLQTVSLLTLPITIYSIYYQYVVVKNWCLLCLGIVGILWLQAMSIITLSNYIFDFKVSLLDILLIVLSFAIAFTIWNLVSPNLKELKILKESKIKYFKFKRDFNLFQFSLHKSKPISTHIYNISEIIFGNKKAQLEIIIVTNPFCGHCKPLHTLMEQILKKYDEHIKFIIRFSVNEANTSLTDITCRLLKLYHTEGQDKCMEAMQDIYGDMDYTTWIEKWGIVDNKLLYMEVLKSEREWCQSHAINFTPAILINGYHYPKEYERSDLIYFIEDLYENINNPIIPIMS